MAGLFPNIESLRAGSWVWNLMSFAFVVGLLSMVILQVFKDLLPWRAWFQSSWMRRWMAKGYDRFTVMRKNNTNGSSEDVSSDPFIKDPFAAFDRNLIDRTRRNTEFRDMPTMEYFDRFQFSEMREPVSSWDAVDVALQDLADLATAGSKKALFELPIEQLCGQMVAAMQQALDHANDHVVLIVCLSHLKDLAELGIMLQSVEELSQAAQAPSQGPSQASTRVAIYTSARQRVSHRIQRAIDGFQISVGGRWKLILQLAAIAISVSVSWIAISSESRSGEIHASAMQTVGSGIAVGILAGFIAPVLRSVLSLLEGVKK
jgi:hypothetical protein